MPLINPTVVYPDVLESCHDELRRHFEPMIKATAALAEVDVSTAILLRLIRLAKATRLLCDAGLGEESQLQLRSASEATVNLLYIMEVGPSIGPKSRTELAEQFRAYGDLAYAKMLMRRQDMARAAFKNHRGMSDTEFDTFIRDKERRATEAANVHGCVSARWHPMNLQNMAEKVRDNPPSFFTENDRNATGLMLSSFVSANSATHGDALSLRTQYNALGNAPLELVYDRKSAYPAHYPYTVAIQAIWAWKCIGDYYKQLDYVNKCMDDKLLAIVRKQAAEKTPASE